MAGGTLRRQWRGQVLAPESVEHIIKATPSQSTARIQELRRGTVEILPDRVCPSVVCYLLCMVPTVWFLELHELEIRIRSKNGTYVERTPGEQVVFEAVWLSLRIPKVKPDEWVKTLEQLLLLLLIVGRWLLPKGKLTHNQLSQLLLVYIGTAGDIVEFFESFKEEQVRYNRPLCIVILSIWSWSLLQFAIVITASKARRDKSGLVPSRVSDGDLHATALQGQTSTSSSSSRRNPCCTPDFYGILISISMQDFPYLILRLLLIFKYSCLSYTNIFFTCKNSLVCLLLIYRLVVIQIERLRPPSVRYRFPDLDHVPRIPVSASRTRLLSKVQATRSISEEYFKYRTTVDLNCRDDDDVSDEKKVNYVIRRHFSFSRDDVIGGVSAETTFNENTVNQSEKNVQTKRIEY